MLNNHLQYWIITKTTVVKHSAKYVHHSPLLFQHSPTPQLPTPSNLASTKNVCWISVKKNNPPTKKQPTRWPQQFGWKPTSPPKKTTNKSVGLPGWVFLVYKKTHPTFAQRLQIHVKVLWHRWLGCCKGRQGHAAWCRTHTRSTLGFHEEIVAATFMGGTVYSYQDLRIKNQPNDR